MTNPRCWSYFTSPLPFRFIPRISAYILPLNIIIKCDSILVRGRGLFISCPFHHQFCCRAQTKTIIIYMSSFIFLYFIFQFGEGSNYAVWAKQNGRLHGYMSRCLRTRNTLQLGQLAFSANKGFLHHVSCVPTSERFWLGQRIYGILYWSTISLLFLTKRIPRNILRPTKPVLGNLYLKPERCLQLKLLVWRESLFILRICH